MSYELRLRPGPIGVVMQRDIRLVRPLDSGPGQYDLENLTGDAVASSAMAGTEHEYYGLPDVDVSIIGPHDLALAMNRSPLLRDKSPEEVEETLLDLVPGSTRMLSGHQRLLPFRRSGKIKGRIDLGVEFTSGPISNERDLLYKKLTQSSSHRLSSVAIPPLRDPSEAVLLRNVDPRTEWSLIEEFYDDARRFTGRVALGPMELVIGREPSRTQVTV